MSRIPSKAMPHAFAHDGDETANKGESGGHEGGDHEGGGRAKGDGESQSLTERAGDIAKKVGGSRVAQVAAGAVVAGAVAVAATKIVRNRREAGEEETGKTTKAKKKPAKKD